MNNAIRKLKMRHNYQQYGNTCKNCTHFKNETQYGGVDGMSADVCTVDAACLNEDGSINSEQGVHILNNPWGVCDEHERRPIRWER